MQTLSSTTRTHNLVKLANNQFDVLVIGGGVTGAGVALDAAARGYKVALVEKADFASGTSSKSTKLVHGGIRYLSAFDFALVHEALVERGLLLQNAPYLVRPVPFVLPIYKGDRHPVGIPFTTPGDIGLSWLLAIGLWLYDILAGRRNLRRHRRLSRNAVIKLIPTLVQQGLKGGFIYYDAQTSDVRLTITLIRTAAQYGAIVANYAEVISFLTNEKGMVYGARIRDTLGNQEITIQARHIVNATGVYSEQVEALTTALRGKHFGERDRHVGTGVSLAPHTPSPIEKPLSAPAYHTPGFASTGQTAVPTPPKFPLPESLTGEEPHFQIEPSKGVHLILSREDLKLSDSAIVLPETEDKRILFLVPWKSRAIFGTTDTGSGDLDYPIATHEDISYLLKYLNRYLSVNLTEENIVSTYAGYRPLVKSRKSSRSTAKLSRTHAVLEGASGLVTITGGKLTTYRRMAQDVVDLLNRRDRTKLVHPTQSLPLQGSTGWPTIQHELLQKGIALNLSTQTIEHLSSSYGTNTQTILDLVAADATLTTPLIDDLPYIKAEIIYACRYEMVMTPHDVLARRTSITLEDRQRGLGIVSEIASLMGKELKWSLAQKQALVEAYQDSMRKQIATEKARQRL